MTPVIETNDVITAGGPVRLVQAESDLTVAVLESTEFHFDYGAPDWTGPTYEALIAPARLTAVIRPTDEGFAAHCPELNSLGYGTDERLALEDLIDAVREYLTFLHEKRPTLAQEVSHHGLYLELLSVPAGSWFAAVDIPPSVAPDAA